jgi:hypothetical protein
VIDQKDIDKLRRLHAASHPNGIIAPTHQLELDKAAWIRAASAWWAILLEEAENAGKLQAALAASHQQRDAAEARVKELEARVKALEDEALERNLEERDG